MKMLRYLKRALRVVLKVPLYAFSLVICMVPFFRKYKTHLLDVWHDPAGRSRLDNLFLDPFFDVYFFVEYRRETDPLKRESAKARILSGRSGTEWAHRYAEEPLDDAQRIGRYLFHTAMPIFHEADKILAGVSEPLTVIQIGCGSGKDIAYFARRHRQHRYIGMDIADSILDIARAYFKDTPGLSFARADARDIGSFLGSYGKGQLFIFSVASLQYVQPEYMIECLQRIAAFPVRFMLLEPAHKNALKPAGAPKSAWRGNFSYTHNYRLYAEMAGFTTIDSRAIEPYEPAAEYPGHENTVHVFYHGVSAPNEGEKI